jgi:hypothetical protein
MNLLFMVTMIIEGVFALGFIFVPGPMMGQFGVVLNDVAVVFARLFGSAMLAFPVLLWYARRSDHPQFRKGVTRSLFAFYLASTPILLLTQTAGMMNPKGWSIVGLHAVILACFAFFAFRKD